MRQAYSLTNNRQIYLIAGLISICLSAWINMRGSVINPDGICYVLSAMEIGNGGLHQAMQLCGQAMWPFYSVLIYGFSKLTFMSVVTSAFVLDAMFTMVTVLSFIAVVQFLGGTRRVLWLAAFVILSAHQFNNVRQYIIRDHGFWACYMLSMLFMLRFLHEGLWRYALGFGAAMGLGMLFRIEGGAFLLLLPFLAFFNKKPLKTSFQQFLQLNAVLLSCAAILTVWLLMHPEESMRQLGRLPEFIHHVTRGVFDIAAQFQHATKQLVTYVLPSEAARDAQMVWLVALVGAYFINIINNVSWVAVGLLAYAFIAGVGTQFSRSSKVALFGYLIANLLITAGFFAERLFFSKRYLIALTLVLLLWVPFALDKLMRESNKPRQRAFAGALMLVLVVSTMGVVLNLGASKTYIKDAGVWVSANLPADARLYSNDQQLAFYTDKFGNQIFKAMHEYRDIHGMVQGKLHHYDYAALRSGREADDRLSVVLKGMHATVIKEFKNKRGDSVTIYKIPRLSS